MKIGLFVPCYIDQFFPQVAIATLELLEKLGLDVEVPLDQTCCGQPMANSGCEKDALATCRLFIRLFAPYDYIVAPSGSCVLHIRDHFHLPAPATAAETHVRTNTFELCEFLHDVLKIKNLDAHFPYKVGLHISCHGQRGMRLAQSSEIVGPDFSKMRHLLYMVKGLELTQLERPDECCGFGGTFAVAEEAVSVKMGKDRIADHLKNGTQVLTAGDSSCLMHMEGIIKRQQLPIRVMHIAEILNSQLA